MSDVYSSFDIYKLSEKAEDGEIDPFTEIQIWKHYFKLKAGVFRAFGDGMRNMFKEMDKIFNMFRRNSVINFSHAMVEGMYADLRDWDEKIFNHAVNDACLFKEIMISFKNYKDSNKDKVILTNYEKHLKAASKSFAEQLQKVEAMQEKYYQKSFEREKAEIKITLAEKEKEIKEFTDKFDALTEKVKTSLEHYREEFDELKESGNRLKQESYRYTTARTRVDCKRADFILENLTKYDGEAKLKYGNIRDINLEGVRITEVINSRRPLEKIVIKKMEVADETNSSSDLPVAVRATEEYQETKNKEQLVSQLKREVEEERARRVAADNVASRQDTIDDEPSVNGTPIVPFDREDESAVPSQNQDDHRPTIEEIPGPSNARGIGSKFLIVTSFKKQERNQINLTQGKHVTLIMPANDKGFAFGHKKGNFGRKIKGYFPFDHVIAAD